MDQYLLRCRHNNLHIYYLSQYYFVLTKRTKGNRSKKIILFDETLKDFENIYRDHGGYDTIYNEVRQLCRKTWEDDNNCFCNERSKKKRSRKVLHL